MSGPDHIPFMESPSSLPFPAPDERGPETAPEACPAVYIKDIHYSYDNCEPALDKVSLTMGEGDFLAIIGPNGGGKTTLLRIMLGLLQPQRGSVRIFGKAPAEVSRNIGYVPQFSTLRPDFPASVLDMVLMGGACPSICGGGWPKGPEARKRALAYLDVLGLGDCAGAAIGALSGGQRQRALVARALMSRPVENSGSPSPFLLLLDEPTASIDPQGKFCFYEFLGKLRGSITMIVVSHDLFMVSPFFSSIAFVNKSLTRFEGSGLSPENLTLLFGQHLHECPVADLQHSRGLLHDSGCTHPACADEKPLGNTCDCRHSGYSPEWPACEEKTGGCKGRETEHVCACEHPGKGGGQTGRMRIEEPAAGGKQ